MEHFFFTASPLRRLLGPLARKMYARECAAGFGKPQRQKDLKGRPRETSFAVAFRAAGRCRSASSLEMTTALGTVYMELVGFPLFFFLFRASFRKRHRLDGLPLGNPRFDEKVQKLRLSARIPVSGASEYIRVYGLLTPQPVL